jgi:hypothetical protein
MKRSSIRVSLVAGLAMSAATAAAAGFPQTPVRRCSADAVPAATDCPGWASFSDDDMCLVGASTTRNSPGALVRGGAFASIDDPSAGPLAIRAGFAPFHSTAFIGFRYAR